MNYVYEPCPAMDEADYERLAQRVGRCHLDLRLGIEHDREAWVFGQGRSFFHIENWYSVHGIMRNLLRLSLLHERGRSNARKIQLRHNRFILPQLPATFEGYTLLHLSDLHLDAAPDMADAIAEAVSKAEGYDLCVMTGDFRLKTFGAYDKALAGMEKVIKAIKAPIYGVLGNHDSIHMVTGLESLGMRLLLNEALPIENDGAAIWLAGIDDPHYYRAENIEKAADPIPEQAVSLLLSHSPEMYRHAAYARFDLMLCGHTHGGQICLPGGFPLILNANAPRSYARGAWQYKNLQGYTSVGAGVCIVDVRLNSPPEITLHHLHSA